MINVNWNIISAAGIFKHHSRSKGNFLFQFNANHSYCKQVFVCGLWKLKSQQKRIIEKKNWGKES